VKDYGLLVTGPLRAASELVNKGTVYIRNLLIGYGYAYFSP